MSNPRNPWGRWLSSPSRRPSARPKVEHLEDRSVPAAIAAIQNLAAAGATRALLGDAVNYTFNFTNTSATDVG
ncbi:MAG: hypothetical protein ACRC33_07670, partial [Gemmataceae bacterium]